MALSVARIKKLAGSTGGRIFAGAIAIGTVAATIPVADGAVFDPEKAIGIVAAIGAWLGTEWASWNPGPHPHDIDLRNRIRSKVWNVLPFLRDHDLGAAFEFSRLSALSDIAHNFEGSSYEFVDPKIQAMWKGICNKNADFLEYVALNSYRLKGTPSLNSFKADGEYSPESEKKIEFANDLATALYNDFEALERTCNRKLGAFKQVE